MNNLRSLLLAALVPVATMLSACGGEALPELFSSAAFVDFGEVATGESDEATLRVDNLGAAATEISLPLIIGDEADVFALVTSEWPLSIDAGGFAEVTFSFLPAAAGIFTGSIELTSSSEALSGGAGLGSSAGRRLVVGLVGVGLAAGDDDDSAGDDDDSADPYSGDVTFTTSQQMTSFCAHRTSVAGDLRLVGSALQDTAGLSCLSSISGDLIAVSTSLESLQLPALTLLGGSLDVSLNQTLLSLGFPVLDEVPGSVTMYYNPRLYDWDLTALSLIGGHLNLFHNQALVHLGSFSALNTVHGDLSLAFNTSLTSIEFPQLSVVSGSFEASHNAEVAQLLLSDLVSIGGYLHVRNLERLTSLQMPQLTSIGSDLLISQNELLPTAQAEALRDQVLAGTGIGGTITIEYNQ